MQLLDLAITIDSLHAQAQLKVNLRPFFLKNKGAIFNSNV